jgi:hypothetical protein
LPGGEAPEASFGDLEKRPMARELEHTNPDRCREQKHAQRFGNAE